LPVNASLITGLSGPVGLAVSGSDLFVVNRNNGTIGEYTTSGATVNAALVSNLGNNNPFGLAVSGSNLFVTDITNGTIGEYNATTGKAVNATLITGLSEPWGIAVRPTIQGDVNDDGVVNGLDISLVASHWLQTGISVAGDGNGDGVVNGLDIALIASFWLQSVGNAGGSSAAAPEPSTLVLAMLGAIALLAYRRCR
jgi:hypothetical protein